MESAGADFIEERVDIIRSTAECPSISAEVVTELKRRTASSPLRRARWCAHPGNASETQEMVIAVAKHSIIPPHRHHGRIETLCVLEGRAKAWFFDDAGRVVRCLQMSTPSGGGTFFYRTTPQEFHTLELETDFFVFVETTRGPFDPNTMEIAPFAPAEETPEAYARFFASLAE